ncbi:hypothetical protein DFP73DRAFT_610511 [Morchella snyderi]|nr:hypothetical protein DFP73DRAFT_610511 [Morchella snyderi]
MLGENSILREKNNGLKKALVCSDERNNVLTHELENLKASPITLANHAAEILKEDIRKNGFDIVSWRKAAVTFSTVITEVDRCSSPYPESDSAARSEPVPQPLPADKNLSAPAIWGMKTFLPRSLRGVAPSRVQFSTKKASPCIVTLINIPREISPVNIASIIRGGKIESIFISRDEETQTQLARIHFSSHLSAIEYTTWVNRTDPSLYLNDERISAVLGLGYPATKTNASRALLFETIPGDLSTYLQFERWVLLSITTRTPGMLAHDAIQEIRMWTNGGLDGKLQCGVIFQSISISARMMETWTTVGHKLEILYGNDECEGELESTRREWIFA